MKQNKEAFNKLQKHLTSHQAKLTEFAIKLKAIVVLSKEMTMIKSSKLSVEEFEGFKAWHKETYVSNDGLQVYDDWVKEELEKRDK